MKKSHHSGIENQNGRILTKKECKRNVEFKNSRNALKSGILMLENTRYS